MSNFFKTPSYLKIASKAGTTSATRRSLSSSDALNQFRVERLTGLLFSPEVTVDTDWAHTPPPQLNVGSIADSPGEWAAVASCEDEGAKEYLLFADFYGYCPIFYSHIPRVGLIASDTFRGVVEGLARANVSPHLDLGNYSATTPNWVGHFLGPFGHRTMAEEISLLLPSQAILINDTEIVTVERSDLGYASRSRSMTDALEAGIDLSSKVLQQQAKNESLDRQIRLSGGNDSRMVLGLLSASGLTNAFSVQSTDPRPLGGAARTVFEKDIVIADELRRRLGMAWSKDSAHYSEFHLSYREALDHHLRYRSNYHWEFSAGPRWRVPDRPVLSLIGGGGESLRGYNVEGLTDNPDVARHHERQASDRSLVDNLFSRIVTVPELTARAREIVSEAVAVARGETLNERMQDYYFNSTSRAHFGHARLSHALNQPVLHPLSNPFFYYAARQLPFSERAEDVFTRILLERCDPSLLRIEFEKASNTARLCTAPTFPVPTAGWTEEYDAARRSVDPKVTPLDNFLGRDLPSPPHAVDSNHMSYLRNAFGEVQSALSDPDAAGALSKLHEKLLSHAHHKSLHRNWLAAKVASALEVFYPNASDAVEIPLATEQDQVTRLAPAVINFPAVSKDGWNDLNEPVINPVISTHDGRIFIDLGLSNASSDQYEFAVYLFRDEEKVFTSSYGKHSLIPTDVHVGVGVYRAIGFVRRRKTGIVVTQQQSATISFSG